MHRALVLTVAALFMLLQPTEVFARGGGGGHGGGHSSASGKSSTSNSAGHLTGTGIHSTGHRFAVGEIAGGRSAPRAWTAAPGLVTVAAPALRNVSSSSYCTTCVRDSNGRIARNAAAREAFMANTGYPHGRPGWVVDHIVPLKRGGSDSPANMQWQTKADAAAKDKWE